VAPAVAHAAVPIGARREKELHSTLQPWPGLYILSGVHARRLPRAATAVSVSARGGRLTRWAGPGRPWMDHQFTTTPPRLFGALSLITQSLLIFACIKTHADAHARHLLTLLGVQCYSMLIIRFTALSYYSLSLHSAGTEL
jgi:hypothetical protein